MTAGNASSSADGGSAPAASPAPAEAGDGEEERPQKYESEVAMSDEAGTVVFRYKSKFFHMVKDGSGKVSWEGRGVGLLLVRQRNDDSKKPFVTFTTEAVSVRTQLRRRVLLNE